MYLDKGWTLNHLERQFVCLQEFKPRAENPAVKEKEVPFIACLHQEDTRPLPRFFPKEDSPTTRSRRY